MTGSTILNVRFGSWHFKILIDSPFVNFTHNPCHDEARKDPCWRWFQVY